MTSFPAALSGDVPDGVFLFRAAGFSAARFRVLAGSPAAAVPDEEWLGSCNDHDDHTLVMILELCLRKQP